MASHVSPWPRTSTFKPHGRDVHEGKGGTTVGINSEMDALPGIGHACGHNWLLLQGSPLRVPSEISWKSSTLRARIVLLGTTRFAFFIGFSFNLLERICMNGLWVYSGRRRQRERCPSQQGRLRWDGHLSHVGSCLHLWFRQTLIYFKVSSCSGTPLIREPKQLTCPSAYRGRVFSDTRKTFCSIHHNDYSLCLQHISAHAALSPWEGQNALDAAVLAYTNISLLRQQVKPSHRIHGVFHERIGPQ